MDAERGTTTWIQDTAKRSLPVLQLQDASTQRRQHSYHGNESSLLPTLPPYRRCSSERLLHSWDVLSCGQLGLQSSVAVKGETAPLGEDAGARGPPSGRRFSAQDMATGMASSTAPTSTQLLAHMIFTSSEPLALRTFLLVYRQWMSPAELLGALADYYFVQLLKSDVTHRQRVLDILAQWMNDYWLDDFANSPDMMLKCECLMREAGRPAALPSVRFNPGTATAPPAPAAAAQRTTRSLDILSFPLLQLAQELTLLDAEVLRLVRPLDIVMYSMPSSPAAPAIRRVSEHFNAVATWIASEVVCVANIKKRVCALKAVIALGHELWKLHNFNGVMAVVAGLNMHAVLRLKRTWRALPSKWRLRCATLEAHMDVEHSFHAYREAIAVAPLTALPYFGVTLRDVALLNEACGLSKSGVIVLEQVDQLAAIVNDIVVRYAAVLPARYSSMPAVREYLCVLGHRMNQDSLLHFSLLCEPAFEAE